MMIEQCQAGTILGRCPLVASVQVVGGCRHEHVKVRGLCKWHADDLLSVASKAVCGECFDAGHDCRVLAKVAEDA